MKDWFTIPELAAARLPDMPQTRQGLDALAKAEGWRSKEGLARKAARRGGGWEYSILLLPKTAQTRLTIIHSAPANEDTSAQAENRARIWSLFEALSSEAKSECERRLKAVLQVVELKDAGIAPAVAVSVAARQAGVSRATLYNWQGMCLGYDRSDWLAALAPTHGNGSQKSGIDERAWDYIKSDYLRPERPTFSSCYRRLQKAAKQEGWSPVPSERSLRRRLDAEVPEAVQVLARSGKDKVKTLYPAQRRSRADLHAMQAVNMDGHKLDVFVKMPDDRITRVMLIALQDIFSGKFVAWRISDSENKETVRLVIGDMVERYGIPDMITLDNGRAFASKWITGGSRTRYRYKVREEEPQGLITTLGIELKWAQPFSGQSKPIERAFRDLADDIARHPFCAGAYTGNKPDAKPENYASRAVPLEAFREHVDQQIAEHNARPGRSARSCAGRSFDETFQASLENPATIVRWPTSAQRSLWLLAADRIRAQKGSGEIHFYGNRYWSRELNAHAGRYLTVRFDPDHLTRPLKVYDESNALICEAECIEDAGFYDAEAARTHAKARNDYQKAVAAERRAHARLSAEQLAAILAHGPVEREERETPAPRPKVTRIATGNLAVRAAAPAISEDEFEDSLSRALRMTRNASILEFPKGNEPQCSEYGSEKKGGRNPAQ